MTKTQINDHDHHDDNDNDYIQLGFVYIRSPAHSSPSPASSSSLYTNWCKTLLCILPFILHPDWDRGTLNPLTHTHTHSAEETNTSRSVFGGNLSMVWAQSVSVLSGRLFKSVHLMFDFTLHVWFLQILLCAMLQKHSVNLKHATLMLRFQTQPGCAGEIFQCSSLMSPSTSFKRIGPHLSIMHMTGYANPTAGLSPQVSHQQERKNMRGEILDHET